MPLGAPDRGWLDARIVDEWAEVQRLRALGLDVRAHAHAARIDRLLDRYPRTRAAELVPEMSTA